MTVTTAGDLAITLGGKSVAGGHWYLLSSEWRAAEANQISPGTLISSQGTQESATHAIVTHTYTSAKTICDIRLQGEDIVLAVHVQNLDATHAIKPVAFHGLVFEFNRIPQGSLPSWHWTYMQAKGDALFHPSLQAPVGAVYAQDGQFGVAACSNSEFDRLSMINAGWQKQGSIPQQCEIEFYTQRLVPAGQSVDVDISFRISSDVSVPHLLADYKRIYAQHFPSALFHADHRAVAQFASVGQQLITQNNPLGYNGNFRRLDSAFGVNAYARMIGPPLHEAGALGIIFWSPGGWNPPMYPPDFDVFPQTVRANIPRLVAGFKRYGLRVGLCARCGDGVTRDPGKQPVLYRLNAENADDMKIVLDRFRHAMEWGFDLFYLDSFGAEGTNDLEILKKVRAAVGLDVLLYTEFCTDMSLPYADHYCEWVKGAVLWTTPEQYAELRYLCPDSTWLCMSRDARPIPFEFKKLGLTPLVADSLANRLPSSQPTR